MATTLPRYYTRGLTVYGTDAFFSEDTKTVVRDGDFTEENEAEWLKENSGNEEEYLIWTHCSPLSVGIMRFRQ